MSSTEGLVSALAAAPPRSLKLDSGLKTKKKKSSKQTLAVSGGVPQAGTSAIMDPTSAQAANTPCRFFNLGQCNKGNACPFLHKKAAHFSPQACKFFTNGFCRNGDSCPFSHDPKILETASAAKESAASAPSIDDLVELHENSLGQSGDFSGSFDSSSFGGSFNDPHLYPDESGSYHDALDYYSRSSSFEDDGLASGPNTGPPYSSSGEPFSLYGTMAANPSVNSQLHQLIHPTTSPRTISSRRSSSEFYSSSSFSSNSASSESSPPTYIAPSPIHTQPPPGGMKLTRTTITSTATYSLPTAPPLSSTPVPRASAYSPVSADMMNDHIAPGPMPSKPAPFRRQSSAQLSNSPSTSSFGPTSYSPTPIQAPMGAPPGAGGARPSLGPSGGRPAPLNRSRSTDQAIVPPRKERTLMGLYVREEDPAPAATFFSRVPPLAHLPHPSVDYMHGQDDLASNGNITPSSTASSSSVFDSSVLLISPRSRQSITSSSGARPGSSLGNANSYLGDFDSYSELGTSDEDDFMFWDNPSWFSGSGSGLTPGSSTNPLAGSGAPVSSLATNVGGGKFPNGALMASFHQRVIEGLLDESDKSSAPISPVAHSVLGASANANDPRNSDRLDRTSGSSNSGTSDSIGRVPLSPASSGPSNPSLLSSSSSSAMSGYSPSASHSTPSSHSSNLAERRRALLLANSSGSSAASGTPTSSTKQSAPSPASTASVTLSPSSSRSSFGLAPGGPPIPRLSRTRKGSFSKSHEDLLANREAPLQSPLYNSASVSGGFGFSSTAASSSGSSTSLTTGSGGAFSQPEDSILAASNYHTSASQLQQSPQTTPPVHHVSAPGKRAIPPMLGSLKSQSTARLGLSSMSSNLVNSSSTLNSNLGAGGRAAPKMSKIGKSQSETGPQSQMAASIAAWKERKEAAASVAGLQLSLPPPGAKPLNDTPGSSAQASPSSQSSRKQQLCMFFIEGTCRYGDACKFVHGLVCNLCKRPCLFPDDLHQNEKHAKTCRLKIEIEESKDLTCSLCKLKIVENNRKFGLLPDCDDIICVPCLKDYRTSTSKAECPVCQAPSHFLIPSHSFPQNPDRKKELTEAFRLKMSKIPCKYYDQGNGVCKYGQHCHFHHKGADATYAAQPQTTTTPSQSNSQSQVTQPGNPTTHGAQQNSAAQPASVLPTPSSNSTLLPPGLSASMPSSIPSIAEAAPEDEKSPNINRRQI